MNKQIKIAFAFAAVVALAMGLLVGLASKENEDVAAAALTTQRTSSASAASGYMVSTGGYTTYDESDGGGKSGKGGECGMLCIKKPGHYHYVVYLQNTRSSFNLHNPRSYLSPPPPTHA